jgi:DNA-binding MarR family transcriptional regulator
MDPFADLAEAILIAARELRIRENDTDSTISLAPSHAQVMSYVDAHPGATPSEAADATGLLRTNLSSAVRELERIGFIEKRPDPNDGRSPQRTSHVSRRDGRAFWQAFSASTTIQLRRQHCSAGWPKGSPTSGGTSSAVGPCTTTETWTLRRGVAPSGIL